MALTVKSSISFEIKDGPNILFQSGVRNDNPSNLTESFSGKLNVGVGVSDQEVPMIGVSRSKRIFAVADKTVQLKLVPVGYTVGNTPPLTLIPNVPILLATESIEKIYVSNPGVAEALVIVAGAGDDV